MAASEHKTEVGAGIWDRITSSQGPLSTAAARALLKLQFGERDRRRMRDLAAKARAGELTPDDQFEAETYEQLGCLLDIIHSKARRALGKRRISA
jgi:hypothetical protein